MQDQENKFQAYNQNKVEDLQNGTQKSNGYPTKEEFQGSFPSRFYEITQSEDWKSRNPKPHSYPPKEEFQGSFPSRFYEKTSN